MVLDKSPTTGAYLYDDGRGREILQIASVFDLIRADIVAGRDIYKFVDLVKAYSDFFLLGGIYRNKEIILFFPLLLAL